MTTQPSPYEADIQGQPGALRAYGASAPPELDGDGYQRVVLTGMGASHVAALPAWRRLTAAGYPAWWVSATQLLDTPELVTPGTLLIATSQSGASGEITQILPGGALPARPRTLIGVTNDPDSPLAAAADTTVLLHSGREATVSTKTYLTPSPKASRTALGRDIRALPGAEGSIELAASRARDGDPAARDLFLRYGSDVGQGLGALSAIFRPDRIVIGGSTARYLDLFAAGIQQAPALRSPG